MQFFTTIRKFQVAIRSQSSFGRRTIQSIDYGRGDGCLHEEESPFLKMLKTIPTAATKMEIINAVAIFSPSSPRYGLRVDNPAINHVAQEAARTVAALRNTRCEECE